MLKIEPPEGCDSRRMPPFADGRGGRPGRLALLGAYGRGKRSITLDIASAEGREQLRTLAEARTSCWSRSSRDTWPAPDWATRTCARSIRR